MITTVENPWLTAPSGEKFFPFTPMANAMGIGEIAHGLAGKYRYAGLSPRWYTVAQHSVEVSCRFTDRVEALWGLLHDAAEAWLSDVPAPLKPFLVFAIPRADGGVRVASYKAIEDELLAAIAAKFGLPFPAPESVHAVDLREGARERRDLYDTAPAWAPVGEAHPAPYPEPLHPVSPAEAKALFLARFRELVA